MHVWHDPQPACRALLHEDVQDASTCLALRAILRPSEPEHHASHSNGPEACNGPGCWDVYNLDFVCTDWYEYESYSSHLAYLQGINLPECSFGRWSHFVAYQTDHDMQLIKSIKQAIWPQLLKPLCSAVCAADKRLTLVGKWLRSSHLPITAALPRIPQNSECHIVSCSSEAFAVLKDNGDVHLLERGRLAWSWPQGCGYSQTL